MFCILDGAIQLIEGAWVNWETLYCPNVYCRCYGKPFGLGLLVNNGTRYGQPQALCKAWGSSIALRTATAYYGLDADPAIFETAVRALAEGNSLRATGRMVQIDKDTVCAWLDRAAQHGRLVMLYLWSNLHMGASKTRWRGVESGAPGPTAHSPKPGEDVRDDRSRVHSSACPPL